MKLTDVSTAAAIARSAIRRAAIMHDIPAGGLMPQDLGPLVNRYPKILPDAKEIVEQRRIGMPGLSSARFQPAVYDNAVAILNSIGGGT